MKCVMPALLLQAYYIFSIGNIKPMITAEYPDCWKYHKGGCTFSLVNTPEYTQIIGAPPTSAMMCLLGVGNSTGS